MIPGVYSYIILPLALFWLLWHAWVTQPYSYSDESLNNLLFLTCHPVSWTITLKSCLLFGYYLNITIFVVDLITPILYLYVYSVDPVIPYCPSSKYYVNFDIYNGLFFFPPFYSYLTLGSMYYLNYTPQMWVSYTTPADVQELSYFHFSFLSSFYSQIPQYCLSVKIVFSFLQPFVVLFHLIYSSLF